MPKDVQVGYWGKFFLSKSGEALALAAQEECVVVTIPGGVTEPWGRGTEGRGYRAWWVWVGVGLGDPRCLFQP